MCGGRGKGGRGGACGVEGEEFCSQESHVESVVQRCAVLVAGDAPKREVQLEKKIPKKTKIEINCEFNSIIIIIIIIIIKIRSLVELIMHCWAVKSVFGGC